VTVDMDNVLKYIVRLILVIVRKALRDGISALRD
jgi:hypothetical protein